MENKKVSVIIIIYKVEQFLTECLTSVCNQTYKNLEIISVVGKGDEACESICRTFAEQDDRIKLIIEKPEGTAVARNQGLAAATGDYIVFVDGDDYVDFDMIETMMKYTAISQADIW